MVGEDRRFGAEVRRRRLEQGLTLRELARRLHYDKGYLSRIERGDRQPSADLARRCDAALHTDGALAQLLPERPRPEAVGVDAFGLLPQDLPVSRGPSGRSVAVLPAAGEGTHAGFQAVLTLLRHRGRTSPPSLVLPSLVAEFHALQEVVAAAPEPARPRYLLLAAEFAEFAGWMAEDAGRLRAAADWTRSAAVHARASGDPDLPAHAMVRLANAAMYQGDGRRTVQLARAAQAPAAVSRRVRGLAALREAQGHALLGDELRCRRSVDRGRLLLAAVPDRPPSALGLHSVADPSGLVLGWCLFDLGQPDRAADVLAAEIGGVPGGARRSRGRFGVRLALAQAASGDVDRAAATAAAALGDAMVVDSSTIRADVRRLARELSRWPRHPALRKVHPAVQDVLQVST